MSHTAIIAAEIKSMESLRKACKKLGYKFVKDQKSYRWFRKFMGDYPLPDGMTVNDLGKCEHAIKIPGANYEIGVIKDPMNKDNYKLIWDFWDHSLPQIVGQNAWKLTQAYTIEQAKHSARLNGHLFRIERKEDRERMIIDMGGEKQIIMDVINSTGETKIETKGYIGMKCVEESKFLKDALGKTIETDLLPIAHMKENGQQQRLYRPICG